MGAMIAGEQDGLSLIIECPPPPPGAPQIAKNVHFEKLVFNCFPLCTYVSTVMRSTFADILVSPGIHEFYVTARRTPKKIQKKSFFSYFLFQLKRLLSDRFLV